MKNPPAFQFYPKDFLSDLNVQSMTNEEVGKYFKLICHCWIENGLKIGSPLVEGWLTNGSTIRKCFYKKGGKYRHPRLDLERQKQIKWHEKSKEGGRESARRRQEKLKGGSTKGQPKANQGSTLPSSSSSSYKNKSRDLYIGQNEFDLLFEEFWAVYPKRVHKESSKTIFISLCKKGHAEELKKAFSGYMDFLKNKRIRENFEQQPMNPETFLRKDRWKEYIDFKYEAPL
jgi:hypothetical protein